MYRITNKVILSHTLCVQVVIRPGDPAEGIVTKTVHKTLPGDGGIGCI